MPPGVEISSLHGVENCVFCTCLMKRFLFRTRPVILIMVSKCCGPTPRNHQPELANFSGPLGQTKAATRTLLQVPIQDPATFRARLARLKPSSLFVLGGPVVLVLRQGAFHKKGAFAEIGCLTEACAKYSGKLVAN